VATEAASATSAAGRVVPVGNAADVGNDGDPPPSCGSRTVADAICTRRTVGSLAGNRRGGWIVGRDAGTAPGDAAGAVVCPHADPTPMKVQAASMYSHAEP
jgi:hypothetical protein